MKERTLASETTGQVGQSVWLAGWVSRRRDHGQIVFIDLRDRSGIVQLIVQPRGLEEKSRKAVEAIRPEFVVEVRGMVVERSSNTINPNLPTGTVEVRVEELEILAVAESLPFDMGAEELNLELPTLLDFRALTLRHPKIQAIFKVQAAIVDAFRQTLQGEGFTEFQAPTIVPVATEGGSEIFPVQYYDKKAFLGQSPQLYKQMMVGVFERVFTVSKAYRAEPSVTTRHLSEYVTLDCEFGFIKGLEDITGMAETVIQGIFSRVGRDCQAELRMFGASLPQVVTPLPKLKMREAQQIIFERTGRDHRAEPDLDPEDEKEICRYTQEKFGSELAFITHYPTKKRPFYTFPDPEDPEFTLSFDLLGRGLEWITGGRRINDYQRLLGNVQRWGNKEADFELYLQAFKYGLPPEGGFALGAERITMQILGLKNVREASLFPRDMERIDFRLAAAK